MRKFDYRAPRYSVELPVRLTVDDAIYIGRCTEISTEGIRLELDQPFETGITGVVRLSERGMTADIPVRVCYSNSDHVGLKFLYDSDEQHEEIIRLVNLCAGLRPHSSHVTAW